MEEQNGNREMKKTPAVRDVHDADDKADYAAQVLSNITHSIL